MHGSCQRISARYRVIEGGGMMTEEAKLKKELELSAHVAVLHEEEKEKIEAQLERYKRMYHEAKKDAEYWKEEYEGLIEAIERLKKEYENGTFTKR